MDTNTFNNMSFRAAHRFIIKSLAKQCEIWQRALIKSIPKNRTQTARFRRYAKFIPRKD